jgi:hypothetical protein
LKDEASSGQFFEVHRQHDSTSLSGYHKVLEWHLDQRSRGTDYGDQWADNVLWSLEYVKAFLLIKNGSECTNDGAHVRERRGSRDSEGPVDKVSQHYEHY